MAEGLKQALRWIRLREIYISDGGKAREDIVKELTEKFGEKNPNVATENMR